MIKNDFITYFHKFILFIVYPIAVVDKCNE